MITHGHLERHTPAAPRLFNWLDSDFPVWPGLRLLDSDHAMRCEEYIEGGHYVLRAELPGVDPDKDVAVAVDGGVLTIRAERSRVHRENQRSEFFYGKLARGLMLPKDADEDSVTASYRDGILEIVVALRTQPAQAHAIPVQRND